MTEEDVDHGVHELQQQGHLLAETRLFQHRVSRGFDGHLSFGRRRSQGAGWIISVRNFIWIIFIFLVLFSVITEVLLFKILEINK